MAYTIRVGSHNDNNGFGSIEDDAESLHRAVSQICIDKQIATEKLWNKASKGKVICIAKARNKSSQRSI